MTAAIASKLPPPPAGSKTIRHIRFLIYVYIVLLVFEGALRKWVVPQLSNPLLIVRDPFVVLIYLLAWKARIFPRNGFVISLAVIAILSWVISIFVLDPYFPMLRILFVTTFGFRSNFLHLPLIFIFPAVFNEADVKKMGRWFLLAMIPMGLLMALQFRASPDSFINRTVGLGDAEQIQAGGGRIRPPGTFSFITGAIFYVTTCVAFLLHGASSRDSYKSWLLVASGLAAAVAVLVSGSRSLVLMVLIVVGALGVAWIVRPDAVNRFLRNFVIVCVLAILITQLPIVKVGMHILSDRFTESAEASQTSITVGIFDRITGGFTEGLSHMDHIPFLGYGLGLGTNAGAQALVGRAAFLLAEGEWSRVLLESGPVLGLAFLLWRVALTIRIGTACFRALNVPDILPLLLFSVGFILMLTGQFGQPTSLGFAVVVNGLCLAAASSATPSTAAISETRMQTRVRGRSPYADRLHRPDANSHSNGALDR
ncbi:MAG: hypothetical protein M3R59_02815 [Verrucomicrobiota bacterium]|nr:hypothetical protein [Verrucomicrobiota bacterium]